MTTGFERHLSIVDEVADSLQRVAELDLDLTEPIYERFFALCEAALPLMGHSDLHMRGRMLEQVFELLMDENLQGVGGYYRWELENHLDGYSVDADMYIAFYRAVYEVVKDSLVDAWTPTHEQAWRERIDSLLAEVRESRVTVTP